MSPEEKRYPGIGLLIVFGGSAILWAIIILVGRAMYVGLSQ